MRGGPGRRPTRKLASALLAVALIYTGAVSVSSRAARGLGPNAIRAGFDTTTFPANDEDTVTISLPFSVNFFGTTYSQLFLNNNGGATFGAPLDATALANKDFIGRRCRPSGPRRVLRRRRHA